MFEEPETKELLKQKCKSGKGVPPWSAGTCHRFPNWLADTLGQSGDKSPHSKEVRPSPHRQTFVMNA